MKANLCAVAVKKWRLEEKKKRRESIVSCCCYLLEGCANLWWERLLIEVKEAVSDLMHIFIWRGDSDRWHFVLFRSEASLMLIPVPGRLESDEEYILSLFLLSQLIVKKQCDIYLSLWRGCPLQCIPACVERVWLVPPSLKTLFVAAKQKQKRHLMWPLLPIWKKLSAIWLSASEGAREAWKLSSEKKSVSMREIFG